MRKHRLAGWALSLAMLIGMLPAEALAAPTTGQGTNIAQYVTFKTDNTVQSSAGYKLTVQVWRDGIKQAEQGFQYGASGTGAVTVSGAKGYTLGEMTITPQNDAGGAPVPFASGGSIPFTKDVARTLSITVTPQIAESTIQNWRRSAEITASSNGEVVFPRTAAIPGSGGTEAMLEWSWSDLSGIGTSVTDPVKVWDAQFKNPYYNGYLNGYPTSYTAATWKCGAKPSLRRFTGEYTIPSGYSARDTFQLKSVMQQKYGEGILPINDDIYIFVYKQGDEGSVNDSNAMDYLAFWSGTSTREKFGVVASNGRPGTVAYQNKTIPVTNGWYCKANIDNIGDVMYANYPDAAAGDTFIIDLFCFDNSPKNGGGMDMLTIESVKTTNLMADIRYWKDAVGENEQAPNFLGKSAKKDLKIGDRVTLTAEELNKFQPVPSYASGAQQGTVPYTVKASGNVIDVVYAFSSAAVQYDLNLPAGVSGPAGLAAPAGETVGRDSVYVIPEGKKAPAGLPGGFFESGADRCTFAGWAASAAGKAPVKSVTVAKDPTVLYGIWTKQTRSNLSVAKKLTDIMEPSSASDWVSKGAPDGGVQANAGDKLVYTITVSNGGALDYTGLNLKDTLTVNGVPVPAERVTVLSKDTPALEPAHFTAAAGKTAVFQAEYIVTPDDIGKPVVNAATVETPDGQGKDPSDETDPVIPAHKPRIEVEKEQVFERNGSHVTLRVGDTIRYTVTVRNTGDQELTGVKLADTMFAKPITDLRVDGRVAQTSGGEVAIGSLPVGGSVVVTYAYTVTDEDEGKSVKNAAIAAAADGTKDEDRIETELVEVKTDVKLHYAFERIEGGGATTAFPFAKTPITVVRKYPGDVVTKEEFETAIAAHITLPEGAARDGGRFNRYGEAVADTIGASYVISGDAEENNFAIKYPLERHTITYHPGGNGTLSAAEGAKGETVNGSIVFTVPYGAVPNKWFTGNNGTLSCEKTAENGYVFNGWDTVVDLAAAVTKDIETTAQWRARTAADRSYTVVVYQSGREVDRRDDFVLTYEPGDGAAQPTLTLNAQTLLAEEQARGKVSQGCKFSRYTASVEAGSITDATHTFAIADGAVINAYYEPYGLTVWHQLSDAPPRFDEAQSAAALASPATARADTEFFGLSRVRYQSTAVAIDGAPDTAHAYTETVTVSPDGRSYAVTFHYYRRSAPGGDTGGSGDDYQTIEDEEIPLAPGLNTEDHFAYVIGYPDGTVRPDANIDRQEVATIFFRLMRDDSRTEHWSQTNSFWDVKASQWSNNAISTMAAAGILTGYEDGSFRPSAPITRGEFAAIAARFDSALYVGQDMFSDIAGHWAAPYINRAAQKGWIRGYQDGAFKPDQYITRAEAMTLVNAVLNRRVHTESILAAAVSWPDNPLGAWHYDAVQEATNSHHYDRENPMQYEKWTELTQARDWTQLEKQWSEAASAFA